MEQSIDDDDASEAVANGDIAGKGIIIKIDDFLKRP